MNLINIKMNIPNNAVWIEGACNPETLDKRYYLDSDDLYISLGFHKGPDFSEGRANIDRIILGFGDRQNKNWGNLYIENHNLAGPPSELTAEYLDRLKPLFDSYAALGSLERAAILTMQSVVEEARVKYFF